MEVLSEDGSLDVDERAETILCGRWAHRRTTSSQETYGGAPIGDCPQGFESCSNGANAKLKEEEIRVMRAQVVSPAQKILATAPFWRLPPWRTPAGASRHRRYRMGR